jgi:hypothetical protein
MLITWLRKNEVMKRYRPENTWTSLAAKTLFYDREMYEARAKLTPNRATKSPRGAQLDFHEFTACSTKRYLASSFEI